MPEKDCKQIAQQYAELQELKERFSALAEGGWTREKIEAGKKLEKALRELLQFFEPFRLVDYLGYKMHAEERFALEKIVDKRAEIIRFNSFGLAGSAAEVKSKVERELRTRIKCEKGKVTSLSLGSWAFGGLPEEITALKYLRKLSLSGNLFSGNQLFFDILRRFSSLEYLDLTDNVFMRNDPEVQAEFKYWKDRLGVYFSY